jgi:hypothetical protein
MTGWPYSFGTVVRQHTGVEVHEGARLLTSRPRLTDRKKRERKGLGFYFPNGLKTFYQGPLHNDSTTSQ